MSDTPLDEPPTWEELNQQLYTARRQLAWLSEANVRLESELETIEPELEKLRKATAGLAYPLGRLVVQTLSSPLGPLRLPVGLWRLAREALHRRRVKAATTLLRNEGLRVLPPRSWREERQVTAERTLVPLKPYREIFAGLLREAREIPASNGSQYHRPLDMDVAIVTDEFMFNYYRDVFRSVVYLTPDNHAQILSGRRFDAFLFVSLWSGIADDEWRGIAYREKPKKALEAILAAAGAQGTPTIFQTIEDPSNYEHFLPIARQFDHIFTTDRECIERYRRDTDAKTVAFGEFGANPLFNNPIGLRRKLYRGAFFAGSYPSRYPERCHDMHVMFDGLIASGSDLIVADRNSDRPVEAFAFPPRYRHHLVPRLEHALLQKVHKAFAYNVNFNSIKNSPTMCAMRIYELQAQGSLILSNYARSVVNTFPAVDVITSAVDTTPYFDRAETLEGYERQVASIRRIMDARTGFDQARAMMKAAGIAVPESPARTVLIVLLGDDPALRRQAERQRYPHKRIVPQLEVAEVDESGIAYVTFFTDGNEYEPDYVGDLVNGFKYTNARYVTKAAWFDATGLHDGPQHEFVERMPAIERTLFDARQFTLEQMFEMQAGQALPGGYAIDPFELNFTRHLEAQRKPAGAYALSVVVPVYNNGEFLRWKCLESLKRNRLFDRMEILIVDDGSSDEATHETIDLIARRHANVRVHRFERGGSGSASRPRNKGVELASAPAITFLDPDNEISPLGYDRMYEAFQRLERQGRAVDLVSGYQVKVGSTQIVTAMHTPRDLVVFDDPRQQVLLERNFPIISTQAAVIRTEFLRRCAVDFVLGAIGQDTLFAYELLAHARRVAFTASAHIVYYAERESSVTNTIGRRFFERSLTLERAQAERLRKAGLYDSYTATKFAGFFTGWYLEKLKLADAQTQPAAREALAEICRLYGAELDTLETAAQAA